MTKSKRLRFAIAAFVVNVILFGLGIFKGADLQSLGAGLSLVNAPVYVYIFGESWRPSVKDLEDKK